jgi:hypothetical protein
MQDRESASSAPVIATCVAGWLLPGLGHLMLRRRWRGLLFMLVVTVMFTLGILMDGELFRLEGAQPLTFLAALAEMGVGLLFFVVRWINPLAGDVRSVTYEYGYTFVIVAGLLNMLIVLDAYDIATGRKE